jgi:hypothetical protein
VVRVFRADEVADHLAPHWSPRLRFFFVMTIASASWLIPALLAYWFITPH